SSCVCGSAPTGGLVATRSSDRAEIKGSTQRCKVHSPVCPMSVVRRPKACRNRCACASNRAHDAMLNAITKGQATMRTASGTSRRTVRRLATAVLLACSIASYAHADQAQDLLSLRNTLVGVLEELVQAGVIKPDEARKI